MSRSIDLLARFRSSPRLRRLMPPTLYGLGVLFVVLFAWKNVGPHYYLGRIFEPNAGEAQALPARVYEGIIMARAHKLTAVNLSSALWRDVEMYHRFGEALYPIRLSRASAFMLVAPEDPAGKSCQLLDKGPLVRLVKCL